MKEVICGFDRIEFNWRRISTDQTYEVCYFLFIISLSLCVHLLSRFCLPAVSSPPRHVAGKHGVEAAVKLSHLLCSQLFLHLLFLSDEHCV